MATSILFPRTIGDDEEIAEEAISSDESDEEIAVKKRKRRSASGRDFARNFRFDDGEDEADIDHLDGIRRYLKSSVPSTLQEKIDEERRALKIDEKVQLGGHFEDELDDEQAVCADQLAEEPDKLREKTIKGNKTLKNKDFFDPASFKSSTVADTNKQFDEMSLSRPILKAILECGYTQPTPIQAACVPLALAGKDICACSSTGTGKTASFMLPILERLFYRPRNKRSVTRILVLAPTRELAIQIFQVSQRLAKFCTVSISLCAGGLDQKTQEVELRKGHDIVIATPGRLIDHLHNTPDSSLLNVEVLVLDEADRMLDEQFADQLKEIVRLCAKNRQTMLFSATMTDEVEDLARMSLNKPVRLFINENTATAANLKQEFVRIREERESDREAIVAALVTRNFPDHVIMFVRTKSHCERMLILLGLFGVRVGQLHGGLSQSQRVEALAAFKRQELDVLICTDLAARGLDIEGVQTVINLNMPNALKPYVHRVGRTARAGRVGRSISLVGENERKLLKEIFKQHQASALKIRSVPAEVVAAYNERIEILASSIAKIQRKEVEEKVARQAQNDIVKAETTFTNELTNVDRASVKKFRYGPDKDVAFKQKKAAMIKSGKLKGPRPRQR